MTKTKKETTPFEILRMDPFGQGVASLDDKILFIPKTLPGEKGTAEIVDAKGKKVIFGKVAEITEESPKRQTPECAHFEKCQGCSYLHTTYEEELNQKLLAYSYIFKNYKAAVEINIVKAPERLNYRNRLQLHYDIKRGKLGFLNEERIHEVPKCLLGSPVIQTKLRELYEDSSWKKLIPRKAPITGHIELYELSPGVVKVAVNEPYAHGGFTQVYEEMGVTARGLIEGFFNEDEISKTLPTLDIFGGKGFLSENIGKSRMVCDTVVPEVKPSNKNSFVAVNLYTKYAMARVEKKIHQHIKDNKLSSETNWNLIIDPPRSGFKTLGKLTNLDSLQNKVHKMAYLSCHPQTFKRDLDQLMQSGRWKLEKLTFLDFFPSTHHLESLAFLTPA